MRKALQALKASWDLKEFQAPKDPPVQKDHPDPPTDRPALRVTRVKQDQKAQSDRLVRMELRVQQVLRDLQALKASRDPQAQKVQLAQLASKVIQAQKDLQVHRARLALADQRDLLEQMACQVLKEIQELQVPKVPSARKVHKDPRESQESPV